MKVVTKCVNIMGEDFLLFRDNAPDGREYVGTIPYTDIDSDGRMKRKLNGFHMCIEFVNDYNSIGEAITEAIKLREFSVKVDRYRNEGHTDAEVDKYVISLIKEGR